MPTTLQTIARTMEANRHFSWEVMARKVVEAMREPSDAMCHAGYFDATHSIEDVGDLCDVQPEDQPKEIWQAMIDHILSEPPAPPTGAP